MKNNLTIPKALAKLLLIEIISKKSNKSFNIEQLIEEIDWYIEQPKYATSHTTLVEAGLKGGIKYIDLLKDFSKMIKNLLDVTYIAEELHEMLWRNYNSLYTQSGDGVWFCQGKFSIQMATKINGPVMEHICKNTENSIVPFSEWQYAEVGSASYYKLIKFIGRKANKILTFQNGKLVNSTSEYKIKTLSILK